MSDAMENYVEAMEYDFLPSLKTCYTALDLDGLKRDNTTRAAIDALGVVVSRMEAEHVKLMDAESGRSGGYFPVVELSNLMKG